MKIHISFGILRLILIILVVFLIVNPFLPIPMRIYTIGGACSTGGGWGEHGSSCICIGKEETVYNDLASDGAYRTRCVGLGIYYAH